MISWLILARLGSFWSRFERWRPELPGVLLSDERDVVVEVSITVARARPASRREDLGLLASMVARSAGSPPHHTTAASRPQLPGGAGRH